MAIAIPSTRTVVRRRSAQSRNLRKLVKILLTFAVPPGASYGKSSDPALRSLANTFTRYAQTQQTAYESGVAAASGGGTSVLERTVEHAVAQVLGRTPAGDGGLGTALLEVFPTLPGGSVATDPARTIVANVGSDAQQVAGAASAAGLAGQISAEQAALYRQASLIVPDLRKVLAGITPFATVEQPDLVDSLRGLIDNAAATLLDEWGRVDEPREALVIDYLSSLSGPSGFIAQFGEQGKVDGRAAQPDTYSDEQQIAGFKLIQTYVQQLRDAWNRYRGQKSVAYPLFTERLARASHMLDVIAQANQNFVSAMDSVGFSDQERRSVLARFEFLDRRPRPFGQPDTGETTLKDLLAGNIRFSEMTVSDYNDWVEKLSRYDGQRLLSDSGQLGLEFVAEQADTLFFTIAPVLFFTKQNQALDLSGMPIVAQVLAHERVAWALDDLFNQLDALASLAA